MISPSTAALAVSVAKGLIKLGQRLDVLLAEKEAVQGRLVLPMPEIYAGPGGVQKAKELRRYLADTEAAEPPDPLGGEREELVRELAGDDPDNAFVGECYRRVFPERLNTPTIKPDAELAKRLKQLLPGVDFSDPETLAAAFYVSAGRDDRGLNYAARVGLLVADVVAEFGAENTALFVREAGVRGVVQSVLERFSKPDLESFTEWSPLLRHALSATLNGLLDARGALVDDSQWLVALMDVLAAARQDPAGGEEFLAGLFQGRGYPLLLSKGLGRAAEVLAEDQVSVFKQLAAEVLAAAAPLVAAKPSFKEFFADHWGDLLRAGLGALERHGPALLRDQPGLLRDILVSLVKELKEIPQAGLLSNETLFRLGDAAIAAIAAKPGLLDTRVGNRPWLRALLESFVNTVARDGLKLAFSREGLEAIVTDAAGVFAAHPELITDAENAGLLRDVVGGILRAVSDLPSLDARNIATAAAGGVLRALAANPGLMDTRYAGLIAGFCERLAELVKARTLTGLDASAIATAAIETLLRNPALFDSARSNLATATLNAVLRVAGDDPAGLLVGATLVDTLREVLAALARFGRTLTQSAALAEVTDQLAEVIADALAQVAAELGRRVDLPGLPPVIGGLVGAWARGDFVKIDPASPAFRELLGRLLLVSTTA